ncbi:hypothetical protein [Turneriella parva]|uniref:Outer membrane protein beta-barrel domain-containing protein n=1 Tax=Turneriella parva (strain ATCC BAA-1111 / DSM 21527 / NCTC 11395 / H) TaxID=869212 RepID=I4B501_TURPD|nr:hypothetical protein [Turneriella parva]AFM12358.1 hypothetical protein Turpa_1710 [Turneriella parva DSM 21527]
MQLIETQRKTIKNFLRQNTYRCSRVLLLIISLLMTGAVSAEENASAEYGSKGTFDLSLGFSVANSENSKYYKSFGVYLAPYANHFLLSNWFARYELPVGFSSQYSGWRSQQYSMAPGIALGYSFRFTDAWRLNFSMGYTRTFNWYSSSYGGMNEYSSGAFTFFPEVKYLITPHWAASVLMRGAVNMYEYLGEHSIGVSTSTYIVLSYIF